MQEVNQSSVAEFILLGCAPYPRINPLFFTFFLGFYLLILVSNSLLITLSHQDLSLHTPTSGRAQGAQTLAVSVVTQCEREVTE